MSAVISVVIIVDTFIVETIGGSVQFRLYKGDNWGDVIESTQSEIKLLGSKFHLCCLLAI